MELAENADARRKEDHREEPEEEVTSLVHRRARGRRE
jgi:hypothetical protein